MRESQFQAQLIAKLKKIFPGCVVLKNDPNYIQGFPDLTVFYEDRWACLEVKKDERASHQPNQDYYIRYLNEMSFARFVCPENEQEVLDELQHALRPRGKARLSERK